LRLSAGRTKEEKGVNLRVPLQEVSDPCALREGGQTAIRKFIVLIDKDLVNYFRSGRKKNAVTHQRNRKCGRQSLEELRNYPNPIVDATRGGRRRGFLSCAILHMQPKKEKTRRKGGGGGGGGGGGVVVVGGGGGGGGGGVFGETSHPADYRAVGKCNRLSFTESVHSRPR